MTARIDSVSNPRIAAAIKAVAAYEKVLLEGTRMIREALDAGIQLEEVFVQAERSEESEDLLKRGKGEGSRVTEVSARVLRKLSDLPSTRGVVAIAAPPHRMLGSLPSLFPYSPSKKTAPSNLPRRAASAGPSGSETESPLFLLLDDVQDPANVGAILRSGEAFGVAGALLTRGCAWPFSPRALRASAGSAFRLPVAARVAPGEAIGWARRNQVVLAGAAAHGGTVPEALSGVRPLVLVIGSEGHGISAEIGRALDHRVTLPLAGRVDSLNAAVAAGILLHVLTRPTVRAR